jgi:hypothetical protein
MAKLKDPLAGDDGDDSTTERDVEKVKERVAELKAERPLSSDDNDKDPVIDLDGDDEERLDAEAEQRLSRKERRSQRGRDFVREANERAERAEQAVAALRQEMMSQRQPPKEEKPKEDTHQVEMDKVYDDQELLVSAYNAAAARKGGMTPEERADFSRRGREIEQRKINVAARKMLAEQGYAGGKAPTAEEIIVETQRREIAQKYGDVISDQNRLRWVHGRMGQLTAEGLPDNPATLDRAMNEARRKFGLGGNAPPSNAEKQRLAGIPRGGGMSSSAGDRSIVMTGEYRKLADAAYPHIKDKADRYKKWAQGPGRRLLEKGQTSR